MGFINDNFLLKNETARTLYHEYASKEPIFDFHSHLSAKEIWEDNQYENLTRVWLMGDHYKWRLMRANGIEESYITGHASDEDKLVKWAETVPNAVGNPIYHWTHLELKRYFDIDCIFGPSTVEEIGKQCSALLSKPEYSARNLIKNQNVKVLCTTDDPLDDLQYHAKLREEKYEVEVLPAFRPDNVLAINKDTFTDYIEKLGELTSIKIVSLNTLWEALKKRLYYFINMGCLTGDHSIEQLVYCNTSKEEVEGIFLRRIHGEMLSMEDVGRYQGYLLTMLGREYAKNNVVMQLHIGALRDCSQRMCQAHGNNIGCDGMGDLSFANAIKGLLDAMDLADELPKTILYCLNPRDQQMLAVLAGCFQQGPWRGKVQLGAAWWFNDHKAGMEQQLQALETNGLISTFVGMLTDSRSLLSYPRHEYFRRILCNQIGTLVEDGEYPADMEFLGTMIRKICYQNSIDYFGYIEK